MIKSTLCVLLKLDQCILSPGIKYKSRFFISVFIWIKAFVSCTSFVSHLGGRFAVTGAELRGALGESIESISASYAEAMEPMSTPYCYQGTVLGPLDSCFVEVWPSNSGGFIGEHTETLQLFLGYQYAPSDIINIPVHINVQPTTAPLTVLSDQKEALIHSYTVDSNSGIWTTWYQHTERYLIRNESSYPQAFNFNAESSKVNMWSCDLTAEGLIKPWTYCYADVDRGIDTNEQP